MNKKLILSTNIAIVLLCSCQNADNSEKERELIKKEIELVSKEKELLSQFDANARYTLSPNFQPTKSLDVINDGKNNRVWLDKTQNVTGQFWKITPVKGMPGYFRLSPNFQSTKSLDVINDGENNRVWLDKTQNVTGQYWKIEIAE